MLILMEVMDLTLRAKVETVALFGHHKLGGFSFEDTPVVCQRYCLVLLAQLTRFLICSWKI